MPVQGFLRGQPLERVEGRPNLIVLKILSKAWRTGSEKNAMQVAILSVYHWEIRHYNSHVYGEIMNKPRRIRVAAAHVAPVLFDKTATSEKVIHYMNEAALKGAQLVTFPESFIPGFPVWAGLWSPMDNHDLFGKFVDQSVYVNGPEIAAIAAEAKRLKIFVSLGISERSHASVGCVWNSNILIGDNGQILNHHRKLVPTFFEKMVWAPGDGAGLRVSATHIGNIGNLICGENTNPLARYTLISQGEQIHISSWPPVWPTRRPSVGGNYDNLAANKIRAAAHSFEAKAFGIVSAAFMDAATLEFLENRDPEIAEVLQSTPRAASFFVDPTGAQIGEFIQDQEGLVVCDFDLSECVEPKQFHDVVGYYNRFDVFDLRVNRKRMEPITWISEDSSNSSTRMFDSEEGSNPKP
jgi:nitrilase